MTQHLKWLNQIGAVSDPSEVTFAMSGIALTNMGASSNLEILKKFGIRSILSLYKPAQHSLDLSHATSEWVSPHMMEIPEDFTEAGVLRREVFPLSDDENNSLESLRHVVNLLAELHLSYPPVLVHCHPGVSRTPAVVAAYIAKLEGISFRTAVDRIAKQRSIAISEGFAKRVAQANDLILE
jgi:protein tyrosine/serine phosphatase